MFESIKVPLVKGMSVDGFSAAAAVKPGEVHSEKFRAGMSRITMETIENDFRRNTSSHQEEKLRKLDSS